MRICTRFTFLGFFFKPFNQLCVFFKRGHSKVNKCIFFLLLDPSIWIFSFVEKLAGFQEVEAAADICLRSTVMQRDGVAGVKPDSGVSSRNHRLSKTTQTSA